jgi:hypothetical protein
MLWAIAIVPGLVMGSLGSGFTAPPVQAQALRPEARFPFLADPLADVPLDPLLPRPPVPRPLSPLELYTLEQDLDQLAGQAEALVQADQPDEALEIWIREVRLRRLLGLDPELAAIDRVAQRIRDLNATEERQLLSARLAVIQADLVIDVPRDRDRLAAMASTYATLGDGEAATALRQALAEAALARGDGADYQAQLEILASLYADWFYFPQAAATYGTLVQLAQAQAAQADEIRFLNRQIDNLEQAQQLEVALAAQQQLLALYSGNEALWPLVAVLQHQIAQNHRTLGNLNAASSQYQAAYTNAIATQQFNVAAEAIRDLATLYRQLERWPDVDYLYQQLLLVEREAINAYGLMETFDQLGQLYELTGNPETALRAYREGLILANQLRHRQAYFEGQINRLTNPSALRVLELN